VQALSFIPTNHTLRTVLASALLAINVGFLNWYLFIGYRDYFHSDSATKVLLAEEIAGTKQLFPDDWFYANGDLFVFFGHLPIVPFALAGYSGFYAHAVSGLIFSLLLLWAVYLVSGLFGISLPNKLLILAAVAGGISGLMAENLFGQASYGPIACLALLLIYFTGKCLDTRKPPTYVMLGILSALYAFGFWGNPLRASIYLLVPMILATVLVVIYQRNGNIVRRCFLLTLFAFGGAFIGSLLYTYTLSDALNVRGVSSAQWLEYNQIAQNAKQLVGGLLALLGALPTPAIPVASIEGVFMALRLAIGILAIVLVPVALTRMLNANCSIKRMVGSFGLMSLAIPIIIFIGTSLPDMNDPIQSARYLAPGVLVAIVVLLCTAAAEHKTGWFDLGAALITLTLSASAVSSYVLMDPNSRMRVGNQKHKISTAQPFNADILEQIGRYLKEHGLNYGYATYWHAGAMTVLSDGDITTRAVRIHNGLPEPFRHLSSNRWYRSESHHGRSFLLLTKDEYSLVDWKLMSELGASPAALLNEQEFKIAVFNENLSGLLPAWDAKHVNQTLIPITTKSMTSIGRFGESGNGDGLALVAEKGKQGVLHYGPYITICPGTYKVSFDVEADYAQGGSVRLDVASSPDQTVLGEMILEESKAAQHFFISSDSIQVIEFRVWSLGKSRIELRGVTLQRVSDSVQVEGP
jgi:hypothetical protein